MRPARRPFLVVPAVYRPDTEVLPRLITNARQVGRHALAPLKRLPSQARLAVRQQIRAYAYFLLLHGSKLLFPIDRQDSPVLRQTAFLNTTRTTTRS